MNFKLPAASLSIIEKMIMGYGSGKNSVGYSLSEMSQRTGLDSTAISRNNGFLSELKLIEGGRKKKATEVCYRLSNALELQMSDEICKIWKGILEENEFTSALLTALKIKGSYNRDDFVKHIQFSSKSSVNQFSKTGSNTLIDIFLKSDLITENDGLLEINTAKQEQDIAVGADQSEETAISSSDLQSTYQMKTKEEPSISNQSVKFNMNVNIDITSSDEFDKLEDRIVEFYKKLKKLAD